MTMKRIIFPVIGLAALFLWFCLSDTPAIAADNIDDDIIFADELWREDLLQMIANGPRLLPEDFDTKITPPPANSAPATRAELDRLLEMQAHQRSPDNLALIQAENQFFTIQGYLAGIGIIPDEVRAPQLHRLLEYIIYDVNFFILRDKYKFKRARPAQLDEQLSMTIKMPGHAAYPSGHGGQSYALALILSELDPDRASYYRQVAHHIGQRREIAGVHYPGDTKAGQKLAGQIVHALLEYEQIQNLLPEAARELADFIRQDQDAD